MASRLQRRQYLVTGLSGDPRQIPSLDSAALMTPRTNPGGPHRRDGRRSVGNGVKRSALRKHLANTRKRQWAPVLSNGSQIIMTSSCRIEHPWRQRRSNATLRPWSALLRSHRDASMGTPRIPSRPQVTLLSRLCKGAAVVSVAREAHGLSLTSQPVDFRFAETRRPNAARSFP